MERIRFSFLPTEIEIIFWIGTCKEENFDVIDKGNPTTDIWFHAKNVSSCHVIVLLSDLGKISRKEKQKIVKKGAELVKKNTAKLRDQREVEINYTNLENIRKTSYKGCIEIIENREKVIYV